MPRNSGGSNKSPSVKSSPSPVRQSTVTAQAPMRQAAPAPPQTQVQQQSQQRGGMFSGSGSGLGQSIVTGMALGAGSAIGHEAVRAVSHGLTGHDNHNHNHHHQQQQEHQYDDGSHHQTSLIRPLLSSIGIAGVGYYICSNLKQAMPYKRYAIIPGLLYGIYSLNG